LGDEDEFAFVLGVAAVGDLLGVDWGMSCQVGKDRKGVGGLLDRETVPGGTASWTCWREREKAWRKPDMVEAAQSSSGGRVMGSSRGVCPNIRQLGRPSPDLHAFNSQAR
jgi:hypothetical protein